MFDAGCAIIDRSHITLRFCFSPTLVRNKFQCKKLRFCDIALSSNVTHRIVVKIIAEHYARVFNDDGI